MMGGFEVAAEDHSLKMLNFRYQIRTFWCISSNKNACIIWSRGFCKFRSSNYSIVAMSVAGTITVRRTTYTNRYILQINSNQLSFLNNTDMLWFGGSLLLIL